MTVATPTRPVAADGLVAADARRVVPLASVAVAVGMTVIVGHDGTPMWRVIRVAVVLVLAGVGHQALVRPPSRRRSAVALAVAGVAVPVGLGIAVPHIPKTGVTVMSVAGVAVLAGGLVLCAAGALELFRSLRRWVRVPVAGSVIAALLVMCLTLGQAVAATNVPRTPVGSRTPAEAGLAYRDVGFDAADGVELAGWYVPSTNGAAVVLLHGAGSTRSAVLDHATVLARHGYGVLLYDARGHGDSGGRAMDFGWYGDADVAGAADFLLRQPDVAGGRIAAVGLSMGGEQALGASADVPALRAVVAEGATHRTAADRAWLSDVYGVRGSLSEALGHLTSGFVDVLTTAGTPISLREAVRASGRPTLLIAAGDVADEAHAATWIRSASPGTVTVWVAPDAGHTGALDAHPSEWEARVVEFLDDALATP